MKITDYKIATEPEVKKMLLEDWEPYGSPFLGHSGINAYQAMVKWAK